MWPGRSLSEYRETRFMILIGCVITRGSAAHGGKARRTLARKKETSKKSKLGAQMLIFVGSCLALRLHSPPNMRTRYERNVNVESQENKSKKENSCIFPGSRQILSWSFVGGFCDESCCFGQLNSFVYRFFQFASLYLLRGYHCSRADFGGEET